MLISFLLLYPHFVAIVNILILIVFFLQAIKSCSQSLKVIVCVGETLQQRKDGTTMDVATQTKAIIGTC
ncbi:hypothetical protein BVRB_7g164170 [Beta vulgaris subsp. vulgaris]|nr:hypothetical protein BVRB_7g164170 [Beta vulgaris subsp. vulgaris]